MDSDEARLFLDECVDARAADGLRNMGYDAVNALEVGRLGMDDVEQLEFSAEENRTLITYDLQDFISLHTEWIAEDRQHCGILLSAEYRSLKQFLRDVHHTLRRLRADNLPNGIFWLMRER